MGALGARIHLAQEVAETGGRSRRERINFFHQSLRAEGADLVDGDLGRLSGTGDRKACAPGGVQTGGERANDHGFHVAIQGIEADDDHRASLGNLAPYGRIERSEINAVT